MIIKKIPCDNAAQDKFAKTYIRIAKKFEEKFGLKGRIAIREGIKKFGCILGDKRRKQLIDARQKVNVETVMTGGGPLPCGLRTDKEWIHLNPQELFVNISSCPYADIWKKENACRLGEMYCEEFYLAYYKAALGDKCQVNVGERITYEHEPIYHRCRLSIYLRPANMPPQARKMAFEEFDPLYEGTRQICYEEYDYNKMLELMITCLIEESQKVLGLDGEKLINIIHSEI